MGRRLPYYIHSRTRDGTCQRSNGKQQDAFLAAKEEERNQARQRLALQILCNIDLNAVIAQDEESKSIVSRRVV
jgi:hypothetical protein